MRNFKEEAGVYLDALMSTIPDDDKDFRMNILIVNMINRGLVAMYVIDNADPSRLEQLLRSFEPRQIVDMLYDTFHDTLSTLSSATDAYIVSTINNKIDIIVSKS